MTLVRKLGRAFSYPIVFCSTYSYLPSPLQLFGTRKLRSCVGPTLKTYVSQALIWQSDCAIEDEANLQTRLYLSVYPSLLCSFPQLFSFSI